jgi:hypothetical protein
MISHHLCRWFTLSLLVLCGAVVASALAGAAETAGAMKAGDAFDAAPFGYAENESDGTAYGVRWGEPRKIRRVVLELAPNGPVPPADKVRVQYWHCNWDGKADRVRNEVNPIAYGWTAIDDWSNGNWKDADAKLSVDGRRLVWTFQPTGRQEFKDLGEPGVGYRKTLKVRVVFAEKTPPPRQLQTLTDGVLRPLGVRIAWDTPAAASLRTAGGQSGRLEAFNGAVLAVRPLAGSGVSVDGEKRWTAPADKPGGIEADVLMAVDPTDANYDRAIFTVRTEQRPLSFAAAEVARGDRILVDDLGALVTRGDDAIGVAEYRQARQEYPRKTIYQRVAEHSEQTLHNAWDEMPLKRQLWFVHGLPGDRNLVRQEPNGVIRIWKIDRWFNLPKSARDTERKGFEGDTLSLDFGLPGDEQRGGRELRDGYLPEVRTWWLDGPIYYEQTTILDKLEPGLDNIRMDDPTVLLMRVRAVNTSGSEKGVARLRLTSHANGPEKLLIDGDCVVAKQGDAATLRCLIKSGGPAAPKQDDGAIAWSIELAPGQSHELVALIPTIALKKPEIEALRRREFDADRRRICEFWKRLAASGTEIQTPETWLNDFYKAHLLHEEITCVRDIEAPRRYAKASSFSYGVFPNESIMMTTELERRGCHEMAGQCLQAFLDFQGTVPLPGNFKTKDGVFFGAGGWEHVGYNKHHGYIMWGMAEHWRFTRDRKWMEQAAEKLIKSCDWITRERQATMTSGPDGARPIHYGLLPAGGLEDVQDFWYWFATNASAAWGFEAIADALADYGHPEAARLKKDAAAYRADVLRAFNEARVRSPVVRLRDGTCVPKFPSRAYERGRSFGWIRETLEGPIGPLAMGLIAPRSPEADWILKDHEDNVYISDFYGYSIPVFEQFWFSRGGFSMQANLLDGPTCYLDRDEIPHFLRAFFNGFASGFFPEVRMLSEHSNPELGYPFGCHFKTPDEAQVCGWLRAMFVREQGSDLYLGQAIPRYWLTDGQRVSIRRAATHFGPTQLEIESRVGAGEIRARFAPPERNRPKTIYLRLRHPEGKPMRAVTLNGQKYDQFDAGKEWIVLPGDLKGSQEVIVRY